VLLGAEVLTRLLHASYTPLAFLFLISIKNRGKSQTSLDVTRVEKDVASGLLDGAFIEP
jgi:hypothetical protein